MEKVLIALTVLTAVSGEAKMTTKKFTYDVDTVRVESVLVYDDASPPRPGLVMIPNWMGVSAANLKQAELVASRGYVVFLADVYGAKAQPKNMDEAAKAAGALKADRPLLRKRVTAALAAFKAQKDAKLEAAKLAAIGFCFGGTAALELARTGAPLAAVVTFHGGLSSPTPADAKNITARILALHGADDPFVTPDEVKGFEAEMRQGAIDWQLVSFGNSVHSFTDPDANVPGKQQYNEKVARRAYQMMDTFLAEAFQ